MMRPTAWGLLALLAAATPAAAHFAFILPAADGKHGQLVLSEELVPDEGVPVKLLVGATLVSTDAAGHDTSVATRPGEHAIALDLPAGTGRVIHGTADAGVNGHDPAHPYRLVYYPKAVVGRDPFGRAAGHPPVELTAVGSPGRLAFRFTANGQPVPGATVTVIGPDGEAARVKTDDDGRTTSTFDTPGRYGAWAKSVQPPTRPADVELRRYATLVVDAPAVAVTPPMPQPAASFGAVAVGGFAYVYGGHVLPTHDYSTASVSGQFHRLKLDGGTAWEPLPGGPAVQGLNLATDGRFAYRVGGMRPRNAPGQPTDVHSEADVARYDPAAGTWTAMPPLPTPRSSHDVAVVGRTLYVIGGWNLDGDPEAAMFATQMSALDLSDPAAKWRAIDQPFKRRALTVAVHGGRIFAVGGFDASADPVLSVDVFDPATGKWSPGPALPGPDDNGFGPSAVSVGDELFVAVGDGSVYQLDAKRGRWNRAAAVTPRIVGRAVADGSRLLVLGGAAGKRQLDLIEAVPVRP